MTTEADFHVTDLQTLRSFTEGPRPPHKPLGLNFDTSVLPRIKRLSITLSRPLPFFQALEASPSTDQNRAPSDAEDDMGAWSNLGARLLIQLPRLRKLQVWLDHSGKEYWSVLNERAILAPIEALRTRYPSLEMVFLLPKVHPSIENDQKHFLGEDDEAGGLNRSFSRREVHRILRQRYRVVESFKGHKYITFARDFPHILDSPSFDGMETVRKETLEAALWRVGVDVDQYFSGAKLLGNRINKLLKCYLRGVCAPLPGDGVDKSRATQYSGYACGGRATPEPIIKKGDTSTFIQWQTMTNDVPYQYNVWWKDGCTLADNGPSEVYAVNPLMEADPGTSACQDNLLRNWEQCNNGGVDGNIQIGCLVYEFKADENKRSW